MLLDSIAYFNNKFIRLGDVAISPFDRGYLFADSIYEVILISNGEIIDQKWHLERLERSMSFIDLDYKNSSKINDLTEILEQFLIKNKAFINKTKLSAIYLQLGRNQEPPRSFFPAAGAVSLLVNLLPVPEIIKYDEDLGKSLLSVVDNRWQSPHIKTTMLLPAVIAKRAAKKAGFFDALFIDAASNYDKTQIMPNNLVREATSSNIIFYSEEGKFITPKNDGKILHGITKMRLMTLAKKLGFEIMEQDISLLTAKESVGAALTASTQMIVPITQIDDVILNKGKVHPEILKLVAIYRDFINLEQ